MTAIAMTYPKESLKDKINQATQRTKKSIQEKIRAFDIWRAIVSNEFTSTVKNNPLETLAIVTSVGSAGAVAGSMYSIYENFQNQKPNSEMNIVIGDKADSTEATQYDDTYTDLDKDLGNTQNTPKDKATNNNNPEPNPPKPEVLGGDGKPGVTFDENDNIINSINPYITQNDIKMFNKIPNGHKVLKPIITYITSIANASGLSTDDKQRLEKDAIQLAQLIYNVESGRFSTNQFADRYAQYQNNFDIYAKNANLDNSQNIPSVATCWKNIGDLADAVVKEKEKTLLADNTNNTPKNNPTASTETDDLGLGDLDLGYDEENAELDAKYDKLLKEYAGNKAKTIEALKEAQSSGIDIWTKYAIDIKKSGITAEDLK